MSTRRHFILGLFVIAAIALLGYFTLFLGDFSLFQERQHLTVHFEDARGLREGDPVLVAGVRWGRVDSIAYDPSAARERRITAGLLLDEPIQLYEGARIRIEDATVLGGRQVTIDPGLPDDAPQDPAQPLAGTVSPSPLDAVGDLVRENQDSLTQTLTDLREIVAGLRAGRGTVGALLVDDEMRRDFALTLGNASTTAANLARISDDLAEGRGTLGRLLVEDRVYTLLEEIGEHLVVLAEDARAVVAAARTGDGVVARLLHDEELSADLAATARSVREITGSIDRGEGTLGVLVREDGIARQMEGLLTGLSDGEGTFSKLLTSDEVYVNLQRVSDDLAAITHQVRAGEGTVGKLLMDDEVYLQIQRGLGLVTRSLEEFREAAPISTMTSVLFSAF